MAPRSNERAAALSTLLAGVLCWAALTKAAPYYADFAFDLGSITHVAPMYGTFVLYYTVLGGLGVVLVATGLARLYPAYRDRLRARIRGSDRAFVSVFALGAMVLAAGVRIVVLREAPITDDESAYRFMAQVLASGSVSAPSPEPRLFFDRLFMVNDGRMFSQYFLGWPALMVPAVPLGATGYVNAVLFGATVPGVFIVARRLVDRRFARLAVVLFVFAPLLVFNAATELSHTSCLFMLVWGHACLELGRTRSQKILLHALFSTCLAAAFFIRPLSALGIGIPLFWVWARDRRADPDRLRAIVAFAVPAAVLGATFLAVNVIHTGNAFQPAYQYLYEYSRENQFRFSDWYEGREVNVRNMAFSDPGASLALMGGGLVRLNVALFGWPTSFLLLPFAAGVAKGRVAWASAGCFLLLHLPLSDVGVDSFGPVHYTELAWPIVLLSAMGAKALWLYLRRARGRRRAWHPNLPGSLVAASILAASLLYVPNRVANLSVIAEDVRVPFDAVEKADLGRAVIFSPRPFTPSCAKDHPVPHHFLFWRPNNDPDLQNDILWVNHLSVRADRELMKHFPDRTGWLLRYDKCQPQLDRIDEVDPATVENGWIRNRMTDQGLVRVLYEDEPSGEGP